MLWTQSSGPHPRGGRVSSYTIAFEVGFDTDTDPSEVQALVTDLIESMTDIAHPRVSDLWISATTERDEG